MRLTCLLFCVVFSGVGCLTSAQESKRVLWSDKPVTFTASQANHIRYAKRHWEKHVYPIGNGRLGCTVFGAPEKERIQFNEDSLWVGNEECTGGYQPFGELYVELNHEEYSKYRRQLDISRAVQTVTYTSGGVSYKRQYFSSYPAQVMVFRFTADRKEALSGKIWLDHMHRSDAAKNQLRDPSAGRAIPVTAEGRTLTMKGQTKDLFWWQLHLKQPHRIKAGREYASKKIINLDFEAQARVLNTGGTVKSLGNTIVFEKCDSLTILLAADTNYINQRQKNWSGENPHARISAQLARAAKRGYDELLSEHVADYRHLYNRFAINLGDTPGELTALPTAARVKKYGEHLKGERNIVDHDLEELMYQYARYLMISCSRPGHGGLPANLQGLWLYHIRPPWRCDYHTDINLQMNYWFVDQANLSECFVPLAKWVDSIREVRKEETRKVLSIKRGWLMRSENNIFGGSTYHFQKGDSAWISQNLWDHYAFTQDKNYLRNYAYPVMKEISQFWIDHLKQCIELAFLPDSWRHGTPTSGSPRFWAIKHTAIYGRPIRLSRSMPISDTRRQSTKCWCSRTLKYKTTRVREKSAIKSLTALRPLARKPVSSIFSQRYPRLGQTV